MKISLVSKILLIICVVSLVIIFFTNHKKNNNIVKTILPTPTTIISSSSIEPTIIPTFTPSKELKTAVFSEVNYQLKLRHGSDSIWDKKIEISKMDTSLNAAKGIWWQYDAWTWIAWKQNDKYWKVLISLDGYDCDDLDLISKEYEDFFSSEINMFATTDGKYCYDWDAYYSNKAD